MSFRPESLGRASPWRTSPGQIDYRLARRHVLAEFRRGRLGRTELCDAHPELLRAARNVGMVTGQACPVCDDGEVVQVSFAFGPRLPAHGRCITSSKELDRLAQRPAEFACYVVEVCPECSWNHLLQTFPLGRSRPG